MKPTANRRPKPRPSPREPWLRVHALAPGRSAWLERGTWVVAALFGAALLFMIAGPHRVGDVLTESDFYGGYGPGARALEHGHLDPRRYGVVGPVFECVVALVGFALRDLFVTAELVSAAAMTTALLWWARIVGRRAGPAYGLLTALVLACNPIWFRYGYAATTDALALALEALGLALLLTGAVTPRRAALAGAVAGLAFLTRYSAAALLPVGLLLLATGACEAPRERRVRAALLFAAGFLVPVLPWLAISLASGARFEMQLHHNLAYEVFAHARGIPWDTYQRELQPQFPTLGSVFARDPRAVFARLLFNLWDHVRLDVRLLTGVPVAVAAALGGVLAWRDGTRPALAPLLAWAGVSFLSLVPVFHSERYSLALLPVWAAFAAAAFASPRFAIAAGGRRGVWFKGALALVPLGLSLNASVAFQQRLVSQLPLEALELAKAAHSSLRPGDKVMARKAHFAWHAGLGSVPFPFVDSLSQLAAAAREGGARWLYFSWTEAEMRPAFEWLLDTSAVTPGLTPRAVSSGNPAVLYEIGPGFGTAPAWLANGVERQLHIARARLSINTLDWRSRMLVAVQLREQQRWGEAEPLIEAASRAAPGAAEVWLLLGDNLLRLRDAPGAARAFERARLLGPDNPLASIGLGWAALLDRRAEDAARLWRPYVTLATDEPTLRRMQEVFTAIGDPATARLASERLRALGYRP